MLLKQNHPVYVRILYGLLLVCEVYFLSVFIHECGHYILGLILGIPAEKVVFGIINEGFKVGIIFSSFSPYLYIGGFLFEWILNILFLFKKSPFRDSFVFYSSISNLSYFILDIFIYHYGDWSFLLSYFPFLFYFFLYSFILFLTIKGCQIWFLSQQIKNQANESNN